MFPTIEKLKDRIRLVLKIKENELVSKGIKITSDEIFNDLGKNKWSMSKNLHLCDIVDDILNYKR